MIKILPTFKSIINELANNIYYYNEEELYNALVNYRLNCLENDYDDNNIISHYFSTRELNCIFRNYNPDKNTDKFNNWMSKVFEKTVRKTKLSLWQKINKFIKDWL